MATREPVLVPAEGADGDRQSGTDQNRKTREQRHAGDSVRLDAEGVVVAWPAAAGRLTGVSEDFALGRTLQSLCMDATLEKQLAAIAGDSVAIDLTLDRGAGGTVRLEAVVAARRNAKGGLVGYDVEFASAGGRQRAEIGLADGTAPGYAAVRQLQMQDSPAFLIDAETLRILDSNQAAVLALGRPLHDMVGRVLSDVLEPDRNRMLRQALGDRDVASSYLRLAGGSRAPRSYGMSLVPLRLQDRGLGLCVLHELTGWVGMHTDLAASHEELSWLARHDHLTGLFNRAMFQDTLELANSRVDRSGSLMSVLYIDLDGFKPVNDRFGHDVGDRLLVEVVRRLQSGLRSSDVIARLGGDEFGAILENLRQRGDALKVARHLIDRLKEPFKAGGERVHISASIGAVVTARTVEDASALVAQADRTMYEAKSLGRGRAALAPAGAAPKRRRVTRPS